MNVEGGTWANKGYLVLLMPRSVHERSRAPNGQPRQPQEKPINAKLNSSYGNTSCCVAELQRKSTFLHRITNYSFGMARFCIAELTMPEKLQDLASQSKLLYGNTMCCIAEHMIPKRIQGLVSQEQLVLRKSMFLHTTVVCISLKINENPNKQPKHTWKQINLSLVQQPLSPGRSWGFH